MSAVPFAIAKTFIDLDSSRLSSAIEVKTQCIRTPLAMVSSSALLSSCNVMFLAEGMC